MERIKQDRPLGGAISEARIKLSSAVKKDGTLAVEIVKIIAGAPFASCVDECAMIGQSGATKKQRREWIG